MSKLLFTTILRKNKEINNCQVEYFWQQAKVASLPEHILKILMPYLHLFPEIQNMYRQKGLIEGLVCKQKIKKLVLELLKGGGQYTKSIIDSVPASSELTLSCINELLVAERIKFSYCTSQESRFYTLEANYQNIQQSIMRVLREYDVGADKRHICNSVKGAKKKAVSQNLTDLFKSGQIQLKQGKYLLNT
ncbi:hypothetical protein [Acinetobacter colistiniresistens]|uniref:hypothetical protein n=1 Tax=Acinetobacter colistiniresistens TaxID=280145 RepID=UPI00124FF3CA|nr:hypothetical protein [Acinetobacter colistiniresistens]